MLSSRQKLILKAIIEAYVKDAQPVGSKLLTQMPYLHFSSATLRYDMAQLEELGYLDKTHTSSGRVPSEKGYRYYVEHLFTRDQDVVDAFPLIDQVFIKHGFAREQAVEEAIKLLSQLTNYAAMAVGPDPEQNTIKKIDFVPTGINEAVVLIVTNKGHVSHQSINVPENVSIDGLKEVINTLDELLRDRNITDASHILEQAFAKKEISAFIEYQAQLLNSFIHAFAKFAQENFYLSGMTNVFDQPEFSDVKHIKSFVDMLDRRDLVKLIATNDGLSIRFGSDLKLIPMENCTVISVPYRISDDEQGTIAVVGPNRMEYSKVIPLVEYIASNIGKLYKKYREIAMQEEKEIKKDAPEQEVEASNQTIEQPSKKEKKSKAKDKIEVLEEEIKELKDKLLRNAAELDNFKKRMTQERINDRKYASKNLIHDILNPLDQLNKIVNLPTDHELLKNFLIGFKMINDQIYQLLEADGLKEIDALGKPFDPKLHYAVEQVEVKDKEKGINIEVIQKGYTYKEQLLRPAMVKVNEWSEENGKDK